MLTMTKVEVIRDAAEMRAWSRRKRAEGKTIGCVPTMGALHEGHLSLMRASVAQNDVTIATLFVNPAQFAPHEDLDKYPRTWDDDLRMCEEVGVDVIYAPLPSAMYPEGYSTYIEVHKLQDGLCGVSRPVFFRGVATVVAKLFNTVDPDHAYFGQKDAQQAAIIQRMVRDLDFAVTIHVMPIIREKDGLAMSSRNRYLTGEQRQRALCISRAVFKGETMMMQGERDAETIKAAVREAMDKTDGIDYVELVSADDIVPLERVQGRVLLAVAAKVGEARLIDNVICEVPAS
jgi:pantoate--beta-alanine ligase